jgi:hypothetical protein
MLIPATPALSPSPSVAVAAPEPVRRPVAEAASAVVTVSSAGARASSASQDAAKVATGIVQASADINHDGTVSDQEQQTDDAQRALKKALVEGGPNLEEALQAYQAIASLADAQR